ncbi:MAG: tRNA (guanosine(37)-N1)-methyltransferase TrmD [Chlorobi bacterium]|nr:tRNA (guanosine(37)-N1)-methyltransferase TrmD [Chlorobiota bacterium]
MLKIDIITVFPEILESPFSHSIIHRALEKKLTEIRIYNLRDFTSDRYKSVDDYPYGGGAGMVMKIEPVYKALKSISNGVNVNEVIYTTPDGEPFTQPIANYLSTCQHIIILCGHYKGIDQRIRDHAITREISIGDYVLSGGELAAAVITDAVVRLIPGVLGDETSALTDTFQDGLLAPPVYTRPANFNGWKVPDILLSGDQSGIDQWRMEQSMEKTKKLRPDLWKKMEDHEDRE